MNAPSRRERWPMNAPSRRERRIIDRRATKVIAAARYTPVRPEGDASPSDLVLLLGEHVTPLVVQRANVQPALRLFGAHLDGLDRILAEIAADRRDDGQHIPALVLIDGWCSVAFLRTRMLDRGGVA